MASHGAPGMNGPRSSAVWTPTRRQALRGLALAPLVLPACAEPAGPDVATAAPWDAVLRAARGQTVNWAAWAGDTKINTYIGWVADMVRARHGIVLTHVKTSDTANTIRQLLADKASGRTSGGRTDLVWINGENFTAARGAGLLWGPFVQQLPNWSIVDTKGKPSILIDATMPTGGFESPWGLAQLTFFHDSARHPVPPHTIPGILDWARDNPGRFTYPAPPDFVGISFVKQALYALVADRSLLPEPVEEGQFARVTAPLWAYLDALHPHLWRRGRGFPPDAPSLVQLLEDRETDIALSFNPAEASTAVAAGRLPATTRAYILDGGTIQNCHFVAIPFNAAAKAGARVVADFLLSPMAQARKADPRAWGDPTVLDLAALAPVDRARFAALPDTAQLPTAAALSQGLPEPHPSWHLRLAAAWRARYAA
jgi:putative thiamine transport system substrate-binding protein